MKQFRQKHTKTAKAMKENTQNHRDAAGVDKHEELQDRLPCPRREMAPYNIHHSIWDINLQSIAIWNLIRPGAFPVPHITDTREVWGRDV